MKFIIITATLLFIVIHIGALFLKLRNINRSSVPKERFLVIFDLVTLLFFLGVGVKFLISIS